MPGHSSTWHYFEIALNCSKCQMPFAFVAKSKAREDVFKDSTHEFKCPRCNFQTQHEVLDIFELDLGHLEEYIKFT